MKKLIIVRHAKSSWDKHVDDKDRNLQTNGIHRAMAMAKKLKEKLDFEPEYWASSPANRALHTAVIFAREFEREEHLKIVKSLYTFSAHSLYNSIQNFSNVLETAIIFGHNEAILDLVNHLSHSDLEDFKTASVALMSFEQNRWSDIENGKLSLLLTKNDLDN